MNTRTILEKLKSRKLWAAVVGVVVGLAAAFGLQESEWVQISGIVTSAASVIGYIFGESYIDAKSVSVKVELPPDDFLNDGEETVDN